MRRLTATLAAILISATACRPREKIRVEPTEEGSVSLSSTLNMGDPGAAMQLVKGFHEIEDNAWRWSMGRFAVTLRTPEGAARSGATLRLRFTAPEPAIQRLGSFRITASAGGQVIGSQACPKPGPYELVAQVPPVLLSGDTTTFDFALDKFLPAGTMDGRELGVIVSRIGLQ